MAIKDIFRRIVVSLFVERPLRDKTLADIGAELKKSGQEIYLQLSAAVDIPDNCRQLMHIITIERWSQSRLRVALGEPLIMDESNAYKPPEGQSWFDLIGDFIATRKATLELIKSLQTTNLEARLTIPHNQYGLLSVKGWLRYLDEHASLESKRLVSRDELIRGHETE